MIQAETNLKVADNSGATAIRCFKVIGGSRKRYARIGEEIVASVKIATSGGTVKKKDIVRAVIVRQRSPLHRSDGTNLRFDENAAVILGGEGEIKGTRVFGPIPRELKNTKYKKIVTMAPEIV